MHACSGLRPWQANVPILCDYRIARSHINDRVKHIFNLAFTCRACALQAAERSSKSTRDRPYCWLIRDILLALCNDLNAMFFADISKDA